MKRIEYLHLILDVKEMTYIDALPKELRSELEFYKNFVYRIILNTLANRAAIFCNPDRPLNALESAVIEGLSQMYDELRLDVVKQIEELDSNNQYRPYYAHRCYYYIPSNQLCTNYNLLEYLNRGYHPAKLIIEANSILTNFKTNKQIVRHYIKEDATIFVVANIMS